MLALTTDGADKATVPASGTEYLAVKPTSKRFYIVSRNQIWPTLRGTFPLLRRAPIALVLVCALLGQESTATVSGATSPSSQSGGVRAPGEPAIQTTPPPSATAPTSSPVPVAPVPKKAVELALAAEAHCRDAKDQTENCELGDTIFVGFTNLREWMDADLDKNKPKDLVLVLNGRVMKGITPRGPDTRYKELAFDLKRLDGDQADSKDNREAWNALLNRSKGDRSMSVSVAFLGNPPYFGPATATFQAFPSYSWLVVVFLLALVMLFLLLAHNSDILRDGPSAAGAPSYRLALPVAKWLGGFSLSWPHTPTSGWSRVIVTR